MATAEAGAGQRELHRTIDWKGAFWVASGVPALVLFSIGGIAATVGTPSYLVWIISIGLGFIQSFTYAEIAGLFPNKSGGASVYGAAAWVRYSKFTAPLSVWCNWLAWTPVLSIGTGLAAGYILTVLFADDSAVRTWQLQLFDLGSVKEGLTFRINSTFFLGAALLLGTFYIQHRGILNTARVQTIIGIAVVVPLLIVGLVPLLTGDVLRDNLTPLVPLALDGNGAPIAGVWDKTGWSLMLGGLFLAAWSTYAFETSICYTSELRNPGSDTFKVIFFSGLLCVLVFVLVPLAFQGVLGLNGVLDPGIYDGSGVAAAMATIVSGEHTGIIYSLMVIMLLLALVLAIITAMAGSSRTLYQGSVDGWLPKYLSHVNRHGAPTSAMWTDLSFNLILLMMSDYLFVLAISNCCYIIFNFLNLNAGWIHRIDNGHVKRPWKAPTIILAIGAILAYVNAFFMGAGANIYGPNTLLLGIIAAALIIPVFCYRHYVTDGGKFPAAMLADLGVSQENMHERKAGMRPYLTLVGGAAAVFIGWYIFYGSV